MPDDLAIESDGGVRLVRLDRPESRNAIDIPTCHALTEFLQGANTDAAVRAIVITGAGRDFCTGADARGANAVAAQMTTLDYRFATGDYTTLFQTLWEVEKPVISAVNGTVAGAGWMLALLADLVVAAEGSRWTHVFTRRGMIPHAGDPYFLPRIIPFHKLNELALLSEAVTADTLETWGLINRLVPADEVLDTALDLARRLAGGPTRSLGLTKTLYRRSRDSDLTTAFHEERAAQALLTTTHDRTEGVTAFAEGRPPDFTGS